MILSIENSAHYPDILPMSVSFSIQCPHVCMHGALSHALGWRPSFLNKGYLPV